VNCPHKTFHPVTSCLWKLSVFIKTHTQIPAELIKEEGKELKIIYELVLKIWEEEITPRVEIWHNMTNS
jgi:hypothetical protein